MMHHSARTGRKIHDRQIIPLIEQTLDRKNPREWYYALLDYGAWLKSRIENPSRRSAHHARQSKFEGSNRQLRGEIVRLLTQRGEMTVKDLGRILRVSTSKTREATRALAQDGLAHLTKTRIKIA